MKNRCKQEINRLVRSLQSHGEWGRTDIHRSTKYYRYFENKLWYYLYRILLLTWWRMFTFPGTKFRTANFAKEFHFLLINMYSFFYLKDIWWFSRIRIRIRIEWHHYLPLSCHYWDTWIFCKCNQCILHNVMLL